LLAVVACKRRSPRRRIIDGSGIVTSIGKDVGAGWRYSRAIDRAGEGMIAGPCRRAIERWDDASAACPVFCVAAVPRPRLERAVEAVDPPVPPLAMGSSPVTPVVSGRPIALLRVTLAGVLRLAPEAIAVAVLAIWLAVACLVDPPWTMGSASVPSSADVLGNLEMAICAETG
jgi:hypothetical protein